MRRLIVMAATSAALTVALLVGPLGAAGAGPYVFGCTPLVQEGFGGSQRGTLSIYNGSAATANLTHKILAGDGTNLNATVLSAAGPPANIPQTSTLAPTKTATFNWMVNFDAGAPSSTNSISQDSVRVVSDTPVAVAMIVNGTNGVTLTCTDLRP